MERLAMVTGAASGIGRAITERFVADGIMHDGGSIITAASLNATQGSVGMSADRAAKAGLVEEFTDITTFVSDSLFPVDGRASTKRYPNLPAAFARLAPPAE